jgi:hypothetical protein
MTMKDLFEIVTEAYAKLKGKKKFPLEFRRIEYGGVHVVGWFTIHRFGGCIGDPEGTIVFDGCYDFGAARELAKQIVKDMAEVGEWVDAEQLSPHFHRG